MSCQCLHVRTCSGVMPCSSLYVASNFPLSNSFCIAPISPSRANCIMSSSTGRLGLLSAISSSSCSPVESGGEAAEVISQVRVRRFKVAATRRWDVAKIGDYGVVLSNIQTGYRIMCMVKVVANTGLFCQQAVSWTEDAALECDQCVHRDPGTAPS